MADKKEAVSGAEDTESGTVEVHIQSVAEPDEKVKSAQPLDLHTEMFMLGALRETLGSCYLQDKDNYRILSGMISKCTEANEA